MSKESYGSGYFGEWIEDEFELPAYRYTCDQISDPKAITPMNEIWHAKTDHWHQVGNDRLVAVASNYGYLQVRQDEGGPKFLNVYDPENKHYAGGFGYLTDGNNMISTFYSKRYSSFERIFGMGYYRKVVEDKGYTADQVIFAPFGDDPILISQITIANNREIAVDLDWVEYWGCFMYQFSLLSFGKGLQARDHSITRKLRREFSEKFKHKFQIIDNHRGLLETKYISTGVSKANNKAQTKKPSDNDNHPPSTFLVSLDATADDLSTNDTLFFGNNEIHSPEGIVLAFNSEDSISDLGNAMFIKRKIHLEPSESQTLYFGFGYLPDDFDLTSLLNKYNKDISNLWRKSSHAWKENTMLLNVPGEPWIYRELKWHNYYLRSAMTYDSFFQEHILSQGLIYQYIMGFQGAARDPLQHVKPFLFIEPEIVKEIIRYTMKEIYEDGEIPYSITGFGIIFEWIKSSDFELWLLWLVSEFILVTRDINFLDEEIPTYPLYGRKAGRSTVRELLDRCYKHFTEITGTGPHGIQRLSVGDWNDSIIWGLVPKEKKSEVRKNGESVLNSAMATYTLKQYAEILNLSGDIDKANQILEYVKSQIEAVRAQWTGNWFKRAWLTEDIGWFGEDQIWLAPQPWTIIGEITNQEQTNVLIKSIDQLLRDPSPIGALLHSKGFEGKIIGMAANAGIWYSINGTLIWALSKVDGKMAWDEWKKNTLVYHAENYPDIWYGIWSGPDTYNSVLSKYPGHTIFNPFYLTGDPKDESKILTSTGLNFTDFPIMNLHSHAWPLYNTIHLIGAEFTSEGIKFSPIIPKEKYEFISPLLGFKKSNEAYSGWYAPLVEGNWKIVLKLNKEEIEKIVSLEVNGKKEDFIIDNNKITWKGKSKPNNPLKWRLIYNLDV
ncbi:MAG: GH36-type glycosyl hydrolase domain-containing protein [Candidatus Hodarchaeota archaeon]